jgi:predicted transcriptional regulator
MAGARDTRMGWEGCYVTLQESYVRDLALSGPTLLAFAIIRGFAAATGECTSTLGYFEWWLGCSKPTAIAAVHELERQGLVSVGKRRTLAGPLQNVYRLTDKALRPGRQEAPEGAWAVDDDSITLQGDMVSRLGLSGRDLVCYATVFARCQDGCEHVVPLSHIAAWMGSSQSTARRSVARLVEAGLVAKRIVTDEHHVPQALYRLVREATDQGQDPTSEPAPAPAQKTTAQATKPRLTPPVVGATNAQSGTVAGHASRDAIWSDFERLRPVVPTTKGFDYGLDAYRNLRRDGLSHADIETLVDEYRKRWRSRYPDRDSDFAPRCQRVLMEIGREVSEQGNESREWRPHVGDDSRTLMRALQLDGRLGHESDRLATERQRAASAHDTEALSAADARIHAWCREHEAEVWGTTAIVGIDGYTKPASTTTEGASVTNG